MTRYSARADLARTRAQLSPIIDIYRRDRELRYRLDYLSMVGTYNEWLCFYDRIRYCRTNRDTHELTDVEKEAKDDAEAHVREFLWILRYPSGYTHHHVAADHKRLLELNKKERKFRNLDASDEAERKRITAQIKYLYESAPATKARARRRELKSRNKDMAISTHEKRELDRLNQCYPEPDPAYIDYNLPSEFTAIPFSFSGFRSASKEKVAPGVATRFNLNLTNSILIVSKWPKTYIESFTAVGYTDIDCCADATEAYHRRLLFKYSFVVADPDVKIVQDELFRALREKFDFPLVLMGPSCPSAEHLAERLSEFNKQFGWSC